MRARFHQIIAWKTHWCFSQALFQRERRAIDQSAQTCPGPSPPVHYGAACESQRSLTTTNISAVTACFSLISCRGDIFRVSRPLWRGREAEPISHHPLLLIYSRIQDSLFIFVLIQADSAYKHIYCLTLLQLLCIKVSYCELKITILPVYHSIVQ